MYIYNICGNCDTFCPEFLDELGFKNVSLFCKNVKVVTVTFNEFIRSLLNKSVHFFKKKLL